MRRKGRLLREVDLGLNPDPRRVETERRIEIKTGLVIRRDPGQGPGLERERRRAIRETGKGLGRNTVETDLETETGPETETDITETGEMIDETETRTMLTS